MNSNSENPKVGKEFQEMVLRKMEEHFDTYFDWEVPVLIGKPAKGHRFDCVSEDGKIIVECKAYAWTNTGNVPSAKLMGLNEALFYMSYLPEDITKILCIKKATHPKRTETLAEYYHRIDGHLFRDVKLFEVDDEGNIKVIKG